MRFSLRPAMVIAGAVAVATCSDAPTAPRSRADDGAIHRAQLALAAQFTPAATHAATRLSSFGIALDNVRVLLLRANGSVAIDTTIAITPGQSSLSVELLVTITGAEEQLGARIQVRQGTEVMFEGQQTVTAVATGGAAPPPVPISVTFAGPGATVAQIRITPRDSLLLTTARPTFGIVGTDAAGATLPVVPVRWSTSDSTIAVVNAETGAFTPVGPRGTVTLRATTLTGISDELRITLRSPLASLALVSGDGQTGAAGRALAAPFVVEARAADGGPAEGELVRFAAAGTGSIEPAEVTTDATGRASARITLGRTLGPQQYTAATGTLPVVTVTASATPGSPAAMHAVSGNGQSAVAGRPLPTRFVIRVTDEFEHPVAGVTVNWAVTTGAGTLDASTTTTASDGTASVAYTVGRRAGSETVTATSGALNASFAATVTAAPASRLAVSRGNQQSVQAGQPFEPLVVLVTDDFGNPVGDAVVTWTRVRGNGTLAAATSASGSDGFASVGYTAGSTAGTDSIRARIAAGATADFRLTTVAGPANRLEKLAGDGQTVVAGTTIPIPPRARIVDAGGNAVTGTVDVAITGPGIATPIATQLTSDASGVVEVPPAALPRPRQAGTYLVSAQVTGVPSSATNFTISVVPAPAVQLVLAAAAATATSGSPLVPQPEVHLADSLGNRVAQPDVAISASVSAGAALGGTTTVTTDAAGAAQFTDLSITGSGDVQLTFSAPSLAGVSTPVAVSGGSLTIAPRGAGRVPHYATGISSASVLLTDASGAPVAGVPVTFTLPADGSQGTFESGAFTSSGTSDANGIARSAAWQFPTSLGTYTMAAQATSASLPPASTSIVVVRSQWAFRLTATPAAPVAGSATDITAQLVDGFDVPVTQQFGTVTWSTSGGTLSASTSETDNQGAATITLTTASTPATYTVTAAASNTTGSITITTTAPASGITSFAVTPARDTLHAFGDAVQLTATARNAANEVVPAGVTWVSRTPASVTVGASGLATAVANGESWIIATEAGGAQDSALVVVQQRVASVMVTPGNRAIYLGGRATFTASAVDGRGNPMASSAFTWESTTPSVATVDAAGEATSTGLGTTQIRATTGGITGVATLTVQTPITRIVVGRDSSGVPVADTTALTAFTLRRTYRAVAYDTLDAPMSGVTFAWSSTNGSVARVDSTTANSTQAVAAANGTALIVATAQGVSGRTTIRVAQALSAIQLSPANASVAPSGSLALVARGVDATGHAIAGGSFGFSSSNTGAATVNATSGVVTGVAPGTANITAQAGGVTSNAAVITVTSEVPPVISFGRDTLSVGRGSTTSIPVFLSRPHGEPVTVTLAVADTFAFFSAASVTIAAGQTATNVTLNGRNAGITRIIAADQAGLYAPDTATLAVQATLRLASSSYGMNSTDSRATQVLLSDPSPPGGTYVALGFGNPDYATASPNPAFIPEGQLAADVIITGTSTASGNVSTQVTPSAIGVNGTPSTVTVYPARISFSQTSRRIGAGQFRDDIYVHVPTHNSAGIPVTFTSSDTNVVAVTPSAGIPAGSYYVYFTTQAKAPGTAVVTASAPGWTAANSFTVTVTTPRLGLCCGATLQTTSPQRNFTVYAEDSTGAAHWRTNSLVVHVSSSDTSVLRVLDTVVTIGAGEYYTNAGRLAPGANPGTAWLRVSAGGHIADSIRFTVNGPKLQWSATSRRIGAGQYDDGVYVATPNNVTAALPVTVTSSDTSVVVATGSLTVPQGSYYAYMVAHGRVPGQVTLIASAPGYEPDTLTYRVTTPRLVLSGDVTRDAFSPSHSITVTTADSAGGGHYRSDSLVVRLRSTDTTVVKVDSIVVFPPGHYQRFPTVTPVGVDTAFIIAEADGHRPDTLRYIVRTPKLSFSSTSYRLGVRQHRRATDFYVHTPHNRAEPLAVTITQSNPAGLSLTATSLTIPTGLYYSYFGFAALDAGVDTLIASAPGYLPDTMIVRMTTPAFTSNGIPGSLTTTNPPFTRTVYAADSVLSAHYSSDSLVIRITSSDTTVIRPAQEYVRILPGDYYTNYVVNVVGPGSATLTFSDSAGRYRPHTTNAVTVTGPSLSISRGTIKLGMRQTTGDGYVYVHVPNNVAAPLTVNLVSTSTRVATVPASVTIPAGSYYAYFPVDAQDTVGTVQVQATALGYNPTASTVQVTEPRFRITTTESGYTTSPGRRITVYAADADGTSHYVREPVTITLTSSAPGVATVDSTTVTIPAGEWYNNAAFWIPHTVGTAQLMASDPRAVFYRYASGTVNIQVATPKVQFSFGTTSLGIGQYLDDAYYVHTPEHMADGATVNLSHLRTARTTIPASTAIPAGSYYSYFRITGTSAGVDTIGAAIASPLHQPDTAFVAVDKGTIEGIGSWPTSLGVGDSVRVTLYIRAPDGGHRRAAVATTYTLTPSSHLEFTADNAVITSITVPANADRVSFYVKGKTAGPGTASISSPNYVTYDSAITVTP